MRVAVLLLPALVLALFATVATAQQPAPQQEHVRGDIVAVSGNTLRVKTRGGQEVVLALAPDLSVAAVRKADLDTIGEGVFVGTTAVPESDGTLRAVEVHLFPESMRGTGEGFRPWDLQPRSTMTNATVARSEPQAGRNTRSTMTNATVAEVAKSAGGRKLQLKYAGGEKTVYVPANTPVVKLEPADRSSLRAGAHLFAIAARQPDGTLIAQRVSVGEDVVPPM
jgi:hypothetical protein